MKMFKRILLAKNIIIKEVGQKFLLEEKSKVVD